MGGSIFFYKFASYFRVKLALNDESRRGSQVSNQAEHPDSGRGRRACAAGGLVAAPCAVARHSRVKAYCARRALLLLGPSGLEDSS